MNLCHFPPYLLPDILTTFLIVTLFDILDISHTVQTGIKCPLNSTPPPIFLSSRPGGAHVPPAYPGQAWDRT